MSGGLCCPAFPPAFIRAAAAAPGYTGSSHVFRHARFHFQLRRQWRRWHRRVFQVHARAAMGGGQSRARGHRRDRQGHRLSASHRAPDRGGADCRAAVGGDRRDPQLDAGPSPGAAGQPQLEPLGLRTARARRPARCATKPAKPCIWPCPRACAWSISRNWKAPARCRWPRASAPACACIPPPWARPTAALAPDAAEPLLGQIGYERQTPQTIADAAALRKQLLDVRACGWSTDAQENEQDIHCFGAAVRDAGAVRWPPSASARWRSGRSQTSRPATWRRCCAPARRSASARRESHLAYAWPAPPPARA